MRKSQKDDSSTLNLELDNLEPAPQGPVECLGITFDSDAARREHFLAILREKLKDPAFRKIEGFPIGEDEDILAMSDPPYYTACPNPFLEDFIKHYGKPYDPNTPYSREPFAVDVSEGRSGLFYDAHSYHTKVPHKAIMRYILHYTEPDDIVLDGFCGTGMTGVAAQLCGDREVIESLGYRVDNNGTISQQEVGEMGKTVWKPFSKLGVRRAVLSDLSPAATFIAHNYNMPIDVVVFEREAKRILEEVEEEYGWMYETLHTDGKTKGKINYTVWSDVFSCPECSHEIVFWETAFDIKKGCLKEEFACSCCGVLLNKRRMEHVWETTHDKSLQKTVRQTKQVPVFINYTINSKRIEKKPDVNDRLLNTSIANTDNPFWFPTTTIPQGDKTGEPLRLGLTHVHHFYTMRNLWILSALRDKIKSSSVRNALAFLINSYDLTHSTLMSRVIFKSGGKKPVLTGYQSGTLYLSSLPVEKNVIDGIRLQKLPIIRDSFLCVKGVNITSTSSAGCLSFSNNSVDYLFLDPPFGSNIMYSELNYLSESWLRIWTNTADEAIENKTQKKSLNEYRQLMTMCFKEAYRVLKPGRWMTVEFSNTKASVWNSIQTALTEAGFIVANVSALDKQQGTFNAVNNTTSVKQDLVISAYKPNGGFEARFQREAETEEGVWDFVRTHLKYLPVAKLDSSSGQLITVTERDPRILYDQMVAYFVRKGYPVPLNSAEFQEGLSRRFSNRDGMYFLPDQASEYDKKKMRSGGMAQLSLFVFDESSAIIWLRQLLNDKPQTFQDIHPSFIKELGGWQKFEKPLELSELLEQNFLRYDGQGDVPSQIHSYLSTNFKDLRNLEKDDPALKAKSKDRWYVPDPNKAGDLEKLRERALLREFAEYLPPGYTPMKDEGPQATLPGVVMNAPIPRGKKLKVFRLEAVRAGFKHCWQNRDYRTIIAVAQRIPETILQEDPKLLMWYDQALTRTGE